MSSSQKEVRGIYEELKGVLDSISDYKNSWFDDNDFSKRANEVISRVKIICPEIESIDSYMLKPKYNSARSTYLIQVIDAKTNLSSLIGRIKGEYGIEHALPHSGNTIIQNQNQHQSQSLSTILNLQERIISEIPKFADGTKERTFLEKLKSSLPDIKDVSEILSLVLTIAKDLELNPDTILKLLGYK